MVKFLLWLTGWKVDLNLPQEAHRCVLTAAPHTSNWDAFYMLLALKTLRLRYQFTIKKECMRFPMRLLLKPLGAIGIDRSPKKPGEKKRSMVDAMVELFSNNERFTMVVVPEGTRAYQSRWRTGFYHTALQAGVPIVFGYLDYKTKRAGIGPALHPCGDLEKDLKQIQDFYRTISPKNVLKCSVHNEDS